MPHSDPEARRAYHRERMRRYRRANPDYVERGNAAKRAWNRENPELHAARMRAYRERFYYEDPRGIAVRQVKEPGCIDCGWYPGCGWHYGAKNWIELDHVRGEKAFGLNHPELRRRSLAEVVAELRKCEPRCRHCHRERHAEEARAA